MDLEIDAPATDLIAMNLTIAALDQWLQNDVTDRSGESLGREIGALYREIHSAVAEMNNPDDEDEDDYEDDEDEEEHEDDEVAHRYDERD